MHDPVAQMAQMGAGGNAQWVHAAAGPAGAAVPAVAQGPAQNNSARASVRLGGAADPLNPVQREISLGMAFLCRTPEPRHSLLDILGNPITTGVAHS